MPYTALENVRLVSKSCRRQAQFIAELVKCMAHQVLQLHPFQIVPDPFIGGELWRLARHLLQLNPLGAACRPKVLARLAAMNGGAIPADQQLASNMLQQMLQKAHTVWRGEGPLLNLHQQLPRWGQPTDHGAMVVAQLRTQGRRFPAWRIGTDDGRQQVKPRSIDPTQRPFFVRGCL
jgi:hypothetical protein